MAENGGKRLNTDQNRSKVLKIVRGGGGMGEEAGRERGREGAREGGGREG